MNSSQRVVREYIQRGYVERKLSNPIITPTRKTRVAAYCRVSTKEDDQLNSYAAQVDYYTKYCASKPEWDFVGIYADEGITGTKRKRRKNFNRMIKDALDGKIDLIVVKSVSRFARNTIDLLSTVRELREKGVKIFFEKENIDSMDSKCDMVLNIYASLAEDESRSISTNIRWRKQKQVEAGEVSFNFNLLYGYRQDENKRVTISEPEAEVIREIYFKYLIGCSYREIIRDFKERGIQPPKTTNQSGLWQTSTIKSILQNEKYMGDVLLQKTYQRDFLSERRVKNTGQAPQKYVENNHPPIIDKTTWHAVQAEIERRKSLRSTEETGKGRYSGKYAFSGKIVCGHCGSGWRRHHAHGIGTWTCKQHIKSKDLCPALPIKEKELEAVFVQMLKDIIHNQKEIMDVVGDSVNEALAESGEFIDRDDELREIDEQIGSLQDKMIELNKKRGRREIEPEKYNAESKEIMTMLDKLFISRDDILTKRNQATLSKAYQAVIAEVIKKAGEHNEFDRDIFTKLVDTIVVKGRDNILFVLKDGREVRI